MNTIKFRKGNTLIVAHRGLSGIEKENTNSAFVAACNRSYYAVETDIHRTLDGKFIINHDSNLKRVAGENIPIEEVSLAVSQSVVLYDVDGSKDRLDLRPTYLENYLSICKKYEKHCVLELKSDFTLREIKKIISIIKGYNYLENVTFISFKLENLVKVRKILPEHSVQFLVWEINDEIIHKLTEHKMDVDVYYKALTEQNIADVHAAGFKVNCWTVNDKKTALKLVKWGIDLITTNILE